MSTESTHARQGIATNTLAIVSFATFWAIPFAPFIAMAALHRTKSTTGWALAAAMLSLPVVTIGAVVSWLAAQPWVSTQALAVFVTERLARSAAGLVVNYDFCHGLLLFL